MINFSFDVTNARAYNKSTKLRFICEKHEHDIHTVVMLNQLRTANQRLSTFT